ncbi:molybdopterin-guanine dinucleotide biosynthesis protein A [Methylobacterium sp. 4-46]|uniref:molybdenum cofactor guanylyltransferase MobA n=1 Tax=unclassified Methylobacterium TaxID=2615210 RepID=UPI000165CBA9|nr:MULTISPECIES: molybdenum cofactor guanylyltransferase MobA [Methylobacterium]ACA20258.1 molybdopterin-guanine dinucleotide biosynthesis protein A [Methylobacterium sp. 4-46]WFT79436.1 molybdenum cofactor guanylyltransferase MobA [Methylobacterium nodulans]
MSVPPTLGVILGGGLARRMGGGDKPLLRLGGETLLARVAARLAPQCAAGVVLSANGDPARFRPAFAGPVLPDSVPDAPGPLAGVLAGLDHAAAHHPGVAFVATVAGDTPFLPGDFVARLHAARAAAGTPLATAASGGRAHYVDGLWPVALRDDLRAALVTEGLRRVGQWIARHGTAEAAWPSEPVDPFLNLNTPDDLALAEALAARHGR